MWPLRVVDGVEPLYLCLQFGQRLGNGLFIQVAEQGLTKPLILTLSYTMASSADYGQVTRGALPTK